MTAIDWVTIVSGLLAVISLIGNYIQYNAKRNLSKDLRVQVQSSYNHLCQITRACDHCMPDKVRPDIPADFYKMLGEFSFIRGASEAGRTSINSFSREHLKVLPRDEHPHRPESNSLPQVKK